MSTFYVLRIIMVSKHSWPWSSVIVCVIKSNILTLSSVIYSVKIVFKIGNFVHARLIFLIKDNLDKYKIHFQITLNCFINCISNYQFCQSLLSVFIHNRSADNCVHNKKAPSGALKPDSSTFATYRGSNPPG